MKPRLDWINRFIDLTEGITSPTIFRRWGGIALMSAVMERKGWVHTLGSNLYPNLYVALVSPPGVGKTEVTKRAREFVDSLEEHHIAPSSVTKAALIDELNEASRRVVNLSNVEPVVNFNSLFICSNELGVLIPGYDNEFMNVLTDIYDGEPYAESRRTGNLQIHIEKPHLNILAACTPSYLQNVLPEGAWDQGFLSRMIIIYNGIRQLRPLFDVTEKNTKLWNELQRDLVTIGDVYGKFEFTPEAGEFINNWHMSGGEPRPDHPKLTHYTTRRTAHLLKMSMCASASETDDRIITQDQISRALDWLIEAEHNMNDIFLAMNSGGDARVIEDVWYYTCQLYMKSGKKPVPETRLIMFLQERTPAHNIVKIIKVMEDAGFIKREMVKGGNAYVPQGKKAA